jgi:hypothetical protein
MPPTHRELEPSTFRRQSAACPGKCVPEETGTAQNAGRKCPVEDTGGQRPVPVGADWSV